MAETKVTAQKGTAEVSAQEATDLSLYKTAGSDADLPAGQRRNRKSQPIDKDGVILQQGDIVDVNIANMGSMTVLGNARGIGWVLCAYKMGNIKCVGTWPMGLLTRRSR